MSIKYLISYCKEIPDDFVVEGEPTLRDFVEDAEKELAELKANPLDAMVRQYYIVFNTKDKYSWRVRETELDMDTREGFLGMVKQLEEEEGTKIVIYNWKALTA